MEKAMNDGGRDGNDALKGKKKQGLPAISRNQKKNQNRICPRAFRGSIAFAITIQNNGLGKS